MSLLQPWDTEAWTAPPRARRSVVSGLEACSDGFSDGASFAIGLLQIRAGVEALLRVTGRNLGDADGAWPWGAHAGLVRADAVLRGRLRAAARSSSAEDGPSARRDDDAAPDDDRFAFMTLEELILAVEDFRGGAAATPAPFVSTLPSVAPEWTMLLTLLEQQERAVRAARPEPGGPCAPFLDGFAVAPAEVARLLDAPDTATGPVGGLHEPDNRSRVIRRIGTGLVSWIAFLEAAWRGGLAGSPLVRQVGELEALSGEVAAIAAVHRHEHESEWAETAAEVPAEVLDPGEAGPFVRDPRLWLVNALVGARDGDAVAGGCARVDPVAAVSAAGDRLVTGFDGLVAATAAGGATSRLDEALDAIRVGVVALLELTWRETAVADVLGMLERGGPGDLAGTGGGAFAERTLRERLDARGDAGFRAPLGGLVGLEARIRRRLIPAVGDAPATAAGASGRHVDERGPSAVDEATDDPYAVDEDAELERALLDPIPEPAAPTPDVDPAFAVLLGVLDDACCGTGADRATIDRVADAFGVPVGEAPRPAVLDAAHTGLSTWLVVLAEAWASGRCGAGLESAGAAADRLRRRLDERRPSAGERPGAQPGRALREDEHA